MKYIIILLNNFYSIFLQFGTGVVMLVGGVTCILTVKYLGKRLLSLISMTMSSLGCIILGAYTLYKDEIQLPCIPMITFCILYFSTTIGISPIPWMLISEVFPVRLVFIEYFHLYTKFTYLTNHA